MLEHGISRCTPISSICEHTHMIFQAGDVSYVPASYGEPPFVNSIYPYQHITFTGHYVENTGNTTLKFLEIFKTGKYPRVSHEL